MQPRGRNIVCVQTMALILVLIISTVPSNSSGATDNFSTYPTDLRIEMKKMSSETHSFWLYNHDNDTKTGYIYHEEYLGGGSCPHVDYPDSKHQMKISIPARESVNVTFTVVSGFQAKIGVYSFTFSFTSDGDRHENSTDVFTITVIVKDNPMCFIIPVVIITGIVMALVIFRKMSRKQIERQS